MSLFLNNEEIQKQIKNTKWEVFPLHRMLPKETVLSIFLDEYNRVENKGVLAKNSPKTKRLREGYWSLFVCIALDKIENKNHDLFFPLHDQNDVSFLSDVESVSLRTKKYFWEFDVKEFTIHSADLGFDNFIADKINPNRTRYGIIIGAHEDIGVLDYSSLCCGQDDRGLFVVFKSEPCDENFLKAHVIFVYKDSLMFDEEIDLNDYIKPASNLIIYQDQFRGLSG